jgi:hypothetical protein
MWLMSRKRGNVKEYPVRLKNCPACMGYEQFAGKIARANVINSLFNLFE